MRDSITVSISACHAEDPGSIPGLGVELAFLLQVRTLLILFHFAFSLKIVTEKDYPCNE